jgi:hypothetical protein
VYAGDGGSYRHINGQVGQRYGSWALKMEEYGGDTNSVPNGPELKNRVGVSGLKSFSSFSQSWGARELTGAPDCFTGVRESSRGRTERLSIPPRGLDDRVSVRSWSDGTGYLSGRRMGERGGKRDGLRIERNSSSASEGKLDLIRR